MITLYLNSRLCCLHLTMTHSSYVNMPSKIYTYTYTIIKQYKTRLQAPSIKVILTLPIALERPTGCPTIIAQSPVKAA